MTTTQPLNAVDRPELMTAGTRRQIRDRMSETPLGRIAAMWQDEGFAAQPYPDPEAGSQRVTLFQSYLDAVDWTDPEQFARALRVFEVALEPMDRHSLKPVMLRLDREGYTLRDDGRIVPNGTAPPIVIREGLLASITDPSAIREHLDRIARAIEGGDAAQAIGSAKELVESTAKIVLHERQLPVNDRDDLPKLVRAAQLALGLHPTSVQPLAGPDGSGPAQDDPGWRYQRRDRHGRATKPWLRHRPRLGAKAGRPAGTTRTPGGGWSENVV